MKRRTSSQKTPQPVQYESAKGWKDVSVIGCVISGFLFALVVFKLISPTTGLPKVQEVIAIKEQLEQEIEQLETTNSRLLADIEAMQTDPFWQEKIAREELNMALPGEIIYKFPAAAPQTKEAQPMP